MKLKRKVTLPFFYSKTFKDSKRSRKSYETQRRKSLTDAQEFRFR